LLQKQVLTLWASGCFSLFAVNFDKKLMISKA